jgi:hypothetical protein
VAVDVDNVEGSLPGYSNTTITVSLTPQQRGACQVSLGLVSSSRPCAKTGNSSTQGQAGPCPSNRSAVVPHQSLALCTACAAFPSVTVSDVARDGHLKHRVWREAGVSAVNMDLASDLSEVGVVLYSPIHPQNMRAFPSDDMAQT